MPRFCHWLICIILRYWFELPNCIISLSPRYVRILRLFWPPLAILPFRKSHTLFNFGFEFITLLLRWISYIFAFCLLSYLAQLLFDFIVIVIQNTFHVTGLATIHAFPYATLFSGLNNNYIIYALSNFTSLGWIIYYFSLFIRGLLQITLYFRAQNFPAWLRSVTASDYKVNDNLPLFYSELLSQFSFYCFYFDEFFSAAGQSSPGHASCVTGKYFICQHNTHTHDVGFSSCYTNTLAFISFHAHNIGFFRFKIHHFSFIFPQKNFNIFRYS